MSTRRARIKAVASLPVRRKNADGQLKEDKLKSPKTARPTNLQDEIFKIKSPVSKLVSPIQPLPDKRTCEVPLTADVLSPSPKNLPSIVRTPKRTEKVPAITSATRPASNPFASPLQCYNPARKAVPSPVGLSPLSKTVPVSTEGIERLESPHSGKTSPYVTDRAKTETPHVEQPVDPSNSSERRLTLSSLEDYNPPSIPESINDETGMDGIVPLQPTRNLPKPLDLLKSEIISENAPVLFDPIIPLPSPSKVRPKLRPAPRLAPHRRNSVQGSASESEDESRRALLTSGSAPTPVPPRQRHDSHTSHSTMHSLPNREVTRIRNDSVCSGVSQITVPPPASPLKERHVTKLVTRFTCVNRA